MRYRVGSDIGGTFTDFVVFDEATGELHLEKCLTTPDDPSVAVIDGVRSLNASLPGFLGETARVFHGTTLVINAVVERKGARTALLTTDGFRDVLAIGSERRYDLYDLQQQYPEPLVPRRLRLGIRERLRRDGQVLVPLDRAQATEVIAVLRAAGVESVAVCLLHAYANSDHERQLRDLLGEGLPDAAVSLSAEVLPEINEYTRTSTTVVNAYCKPLMDSYLSTLLDGLGAEGLSGDLLIMLSSGGVTAVDTARRYPVRVIESGPVGGVIMSQHVKNLAGIDNAFAFDMGGTTAKLCLLEGDTIRRTGEYEVARVHRFKSGSGIPIKVPCIDLLEIGAGGGSIAAINPLNLLQVGPESAGAAPGPACYGGGGGRPTVTDADLLLGYLDPGYFLGGAMPLDAEASRRAIHEHIGRPLGIDDTLAAWGIHDAVNESMAAASKMYAAERGVDPAGLALIASGGAGPVHCFGLARKLGIRRVVIPVAVGVASAVGFLVAPVSYDLVRTHKVPLADADLGVVEALYRELEVEATAVMVKAGEGDAPNYLRSADIRYVGQGYEINVPLPSGSVETLGRQALQDHFRAAYEEIFGRIFQDNQFEIVNLRLIARGAEPDSPVRRRRVAAGEALKGRRPAYDHGQRAFVEHRVYDRHAVPADLPIEGPAIIEERESTTVIGAGGRARIDDHGLIHIEIDGD
jgi:N-methylhydantoinase A